MDSKNNKETILSRVVVVLLILVLMPILVPVPVLVLLLVLGPGPGQGLAQFPVPHLQLSVLPAQQEDPPAEIAAKCFPWQAQEGHLSGIHYISRHLPICRNCR